LKAYANITDLFQAFSKMKVLIVGDVMIDSYLWGNVERISPEAPVPIVHVSKRESRPGGAANVAINIKALGATPILVSVTGDDYQGEQLTSLLTENGLSSAGILRSVSRTTTVKTRVIGNQHQLIRVDEEVVEDLSRKDADLLIKHFHDLIESEIPDVIILEDYDKGILSEVVIKAIINKANDSGIPVTVDPKKKNFNTYKNATLFKPNLSELKEGLKIDFDKNDRQALQAAIQSIIENKDHQWVMVTLSEAGVLIAGKSDSKIIPAHIRDISDVSGAGDTVISVASLALAAGLSMTSVASLANLAGGLVCEIVGVAPIDKNTLINECNDLSLLTGETNNS
jgi:D-glycero-beta-D-manno-heptose-7-phosphate kinase